jgi:fibronectin-binding autotransporter adhesin
MSKKMRVRQARLLRGFCGLVILVSYCVPAWADDCGRPAIFWISGSGSFDASINFAGAGGSPTNCAPLATDNVTFGAYPGVYPTSGTVTFAGGETVNSLLVASSGWTFALNGNINVTQGIVFGNSTLTLTGGNTIMADPSAGVLSGDALVIPDNSGFSGAKVSLLSLSMTGGGSISAQQGGTISSVQLAGGSSVQMQGGAATAELEIDSGSINASTVSARSGTTGGSLFLAAGGGGEALALTGGTQVSAGQLYVGVGYGNTVTASGSSLTAGKTYVYDSLSLQNGATLASGPLTVGAGHLTVQSGAQVTSTTSLVSGAGSSGLLGAYLTGTNSLWTINGGLNISNSGVDVAAGGRLNVTGAGSIGLLASPGRTSTLLLDGAGTMLSATGSVTLGQAAGASAGTAAMYVQNGASATLGGNLNVGGAAPGQLTQSGGTLQDAGAAVGGNTIGVGTVTIKGGAWTSSGTLTVGASGNSAVSQSTLVQSGGAITAQELVLNANDASDTLPPVPVYSLNAGTLQVNDSLMQNGPVQQTGGSVKVSDDLIATRGTYALSGTGMLTVDGGVTLTRASSGFSSFAQVGNATVAIAGLLNVSGGQYRFGACGCHGAASSDAVLTAGSVMVSEGSNFNQNGGSVQVAGGLTVQGSASEYRLVSGASSVGGTTSISAEGSMSQSGGTFLTSVLSLSSGAAYALSGGSLTSGSLSIGGSANAAMASQFLQSGGSSATITGAVLNAGTLSISGATMHAGSYTQLAGGSKLLLNGGTLDPPAVSIAGGQLSGTGSIDGNLTVSHAMVQVGGSTPGALDIAGNYHQTGGELIFEVTGNGSGGFLDSAIELDHGSSVAISGTTIALDFLDGANPTAFFANGRANIGTFLTEAGLAQLPLGSFGSGDLFAYEVGSGPLVYLNFDAANGKLGTSSSSGGNGSGGSGSGSSVPEPPGLLLLLTALGVLSVAPRALRRVTR